MDVPSLLLLLAVPSLVSAENIWQVHLAYGPAPPPDKRPQFSRNARYDASLLKYQIPAIVGSYVGVVCIIGIAIIIFGRRMRKEAQNGKKPVSKEMVKPSRAYEQSPASPGDSASLWGRSRWGSPRMGSTKSKASISSPIMTNPVSFDPAVLEHDKAARQNEMERIYAEIIAQETKAPKAVSVREQEVYDDAGPYTSSSRRHERTSSTGTRTYSQGQGSDRWSNESGPFQPQSAQRTGTVQPNYSHQGMPGEALSPGLSFAGYYPSGELMSSPPPVPPPSSRPLSTASRQLPPPYTHTRQISNASARSKRSRAGSIRDLPISGPIRIPDEQEVPTPQHALSPRSPRTPRWYKDPGRPPTPPTALERPSTPFEDDSDSDLEKMRSPRTPRGRTERATPDYTSSDEEIHTDDDEQDAHVTESIGQTYGYGDLKSPLPPPNAAPQRHTGRTPPPPSLTISQASPLPQPASGLHISRTNIPSTITRTNTPGTLSLRSQNKTPAGSSTNTLPFRSFNPPAPTSPTTPAQNRTFSPGATKTTFLSPRRDRFLPGGMHAIGPQGLVPNTAALLSAGLATPYSPYMPFSPMTPVTPHLVNRRERKEMAKEKGRQAATEEDVVQDDKELWGDGWS